MNSNGTVGRSNSECCEKCFRFSNSLNYCINPSCPCHSSKREITNGYVAPFLTQPESKGWEEELKDIADSLFERVYQQGRRDALEELEGKIKKEKWLGGMSLDTDEQNKGITTVLNIIKSIKGE